MRLIEADDLLERYNGNILTARTDYAECCRDIIEDIWQAPTIDAVEVVMCGDCKHFNGANDADGYVTVVGYCNHINHHIFPCRYDFYCADGEKKEVQDGTD